MVSVFASVNLPLHHKVQKFSSGIGSPGWSRRKGRKMVVVVVVVTMDSFPLVETTFKVHSKVNSSVTVKSHISSR